MEKIRACQSSVTVVLMLVLMNNVVIVNARIVIVGGDQHWHFGVNYTDWALKAAPFHVGDTLVFRYARPNGTIFHNVYKLHDYSKFKGCDVRGAVLLAHENRGVGLGFPFVLKERKPYYFACGIKNGFHCQVGLMKFSVKPC
eukprot:Gb_02270 [translate_table: standard]